eukprot:5629552-Karenia_brevis.AAC.1
MRAWLNRQDVVYHNSACAVTVELCAMSAKFFVKITSEFSCVSAVLAKRFYILDMTSSARNSTRET